MSKIKSPLSDAIKNKHKGAIGVVSFDSLKSIALTEAIIVQSNHLGLNDDQFIPETLTIAINSDRTIGSLEQQAAICIDHGCDIVAIPYYISTPTLELMTKRLGTKAIIMAQEKGESNEDFAKRVAETSVYMPPENIIRPATSYEFLENETLVEEALEKDASDRLQRMKERSRDHEYPYSILKTVPGFVGVYGGAGPLASTRLCHKLAEQSNSLILWNCNSAPGKLRYEEGGPSYFSHYKKIGEFFKELVPSPDVLALACNTVHKRAAEFIEASAHSKLLDMRDSVFNHVGPKEKIAILGTPVTTGVGLRDGDIGIYEELRREKYPDTAPFISVTESQQERVTDAIYKIKAGSIEEAKILILEVTEELRKIHGNIPILLACTELPAAFDPIELAENNFLDPAVYTGLDAVNIIKNLKPSPHPLDPRKESNPRAKL